jgi:hypothetical protein
MYQLEGLIEVKETGLQVEVSSLTKNESFVSKSGAPLRGAFARGAVISTKKGAFPSTRTNGGERLRKGGVSVLSGAVSA